jgi:hypothetical protein
MAKEGFEQTNLERVRVVEEQRHRHFRQSLLVDAFSPKEKSGEKKGSKSNQKGGKRKQRRRERKCAAETTKKVRVGGRNTRKLALCGLRRISSAARIDAEGEKGGDCALHVLLRGGMKGFVRREEDQR